MINPGTYNITAYQGATYKLEMLWSIGGTAVNLTNYTAEMQVRESVASSSAVLSLSTDSEIALGGTAGTIDITVDAEDMEAAPAGTFIYDLELNSGGEVTRLIQGNFVIQPEVTR